jgi:hypothetical protein
METIFQNKNSLKQKPLKLCSNSEKIQNKKFLKESDSNEKICIKMNDFTKSEKFCESSFNEINLEQIWMGPSLSNNTFEQFCRFCKSINHEMSKCKDYHQRFVTLFIRLEQFKIFLSSSFILEKIPDSFKSCSLTQIEKVFLLSECFIFMTMVMSKILDMFITLLDQTTIFELLTEIKSNIESHLEELKFSFSESEQMLKEKLLTLSDQIKSIEETLQHLQRQGESANNPPEDHPDDADDPQELIASDPKYQPFESSAGRIQNISIYPTKNDLLKNSKIPLNPLNKNKKFRSCEEYVETHFRLIREDFIQALREGFHLYKDELTSEMGFKNFNVAICERVSVIK